MKARKFFGVLFTIIGAMTVFISVAVLVLPLVANDQTRLVLESFHQPSDNPVVNAMNQCITFIMENGTLTLALGAGVLLTGILLLLSAAKLEEELAAKRRSAQRKTPSSTQAAPVWKARPSGEAASQNPFANPAVEQASQTKPTVSPAPDRTQELEALTPFQSSAPLSPTNPLASKARHQDHSFYQRPPEPEISMPPDDQVTSFGTARRIASTPATEEKTVPVAEEKPAPAPAPQPQPKPAVTPIFSTGFHLPDKAPAAPAETAPEAAVPERMPEEIAAPAKPVIPEPPAAPAAPVTPAPEATPKRSKVVIKSTMGKHSV